MAKKKPHDDNEDVVAPAGSDTTSGTAAEDSSPKEQSHPLMEEIQTFMVMRDELAQKLAAEIEETERRLDELKQTAASLFPQPLESPDEKKAKKPKPKPPREVTPAPESSEQA